MSQARLLVKTIGFFGCAYVIGLPVQDRYEQVIEREKEVVGFTRENVIDGVVTTGM